VNPHSGRGYSIGLWRTLVRPALERHGITATLVETQHAGHAGEYVRDLKNDLSKYDLCMLISGDGLLNEVLNGLLARFIPADLLPTSPAFHVELQASLHSLPVAILPGGTSNGLVTSLFGRQADFVDVLQKVLSSPSKSVDIMSIQSPVLVGPDGTDDPVATEFSRRMAKQNEKPVVRIDMLCYLYGIVADNDHYVERTFRGWPHLLRTTLGPLFAMLFSPMYPATIRFLPQPVTCAEALEHHYTDTQNLDRWAPDERWRVMKAEWKSWVVMNVDWAASDVRMAPSARVDDGSIYACVMRIPIPLWKTLRIFTKLESGTHNEEPACEYFKISEFVVHPESSNGAMIISGEPLPVRSTHGKVQAKAACFVF
jgi:sphingosine kinase